MSDRGKKRQIAYDAYEKLADAYAAQVDTKPHNAYLERPATRSLIPNVRGKRVLDAGCGPGSNTQWLVNQGAHVIAVDSSPKMIEHAKKKLGDSAEIQLHDLHEPFTFIPDNSIDLVLAALVLDYIEDWLPVFKEFKRILSPEGALVFSVGHPFADYLLKEGSDYFQVEYFEMTWTGFSVQVLMPSYRRPLGYITEALNQSGFIIDCLIESRPTLDYEKADPEGYRKVSKRPSFLCIRAKPRQGR